MIEVAQDVTEVMRRDGVIKKASWSKGYLVKSLEVTGVSQSQDLAVKKMHDFCRDL